MKSGLKIFWLAFGLMPLSSMLGIASAQEKLKAQIGQDDYIAAANLDPAHPLYKEFLERLPKVDLGAEAGGVYYILEGDLRLTEKQLSGILKSYAAAYASGSDHTPVTRRSSDELIVMTKGETLAKWDKQNRKLTYAIDRKTFSASDYTRVKENFRKAVPAWTDNCNCGLSITHRPEFDMNPSLDKVTFIIRYDAKMLDFLALAFFPTDPKFSRYLLVGPSYFEPNGYDPVGIFRHEIGHILGYRHAFVAGVPGCEYYNKAEDRNWKALSSYDSESVMHYLCGGGGSPAFTLSKKDKADHKKYYSN
ncbi:hypothetical protein KBI52_20995 [Microvirga sp. HBU67558]|uniref:matrixin family metalloprotease n=1 Tax=Microvirga TaxID=186650 RepID=UPI001B36E297|nr:MULTISPECIES: matrixin family metalloprotease [unclassified Microvirga]MBQ0822667.1 hypothetical protein [Microvirga sp. HBU67558]